MQRTFIIVGTLYTNRILRLRLWLWLPVQREMQRKSPTLTLTLTTPAEDYVDVTTLFTAARSWEEAAPAAAVSLVLPHPEAARDARTAATVCRSLRRQYSRTDRSDDAKRRLDARAIILKTFQQDSLGTSAGKFPNFRLEMTRRDSRSCYLKSHGVGHVHVTATRKRDISIFVWLYRFRPFCIYILRLDVAFWLTLKYALLEDNKREHLHNVCFLFLLDRGNAYNTLQKGHVFDLPSRNSQKIDIAAVFV